MRKNLFGSEFGNVLSRLGEPIEFYEKSGSNIIKASLKNSTRAVYNLEFREFYIEGQAFFTFPDGCLLENGSYFRRLGFPQKNYMLISIEPEITSENLCYIYATETNANVTIQKIKKEKDLKGKDLYLVNTYAENIPSLFYLTLRSGKTTNDGSIDQTIYTALIPARIPISPFDRVIKKTYVNNQYVDENYQVESVSTSLLREDNGKISGIVSLQMTKDLRDVK